jgi:Cdc6-like AAA superfamily ATPase
MLLEKDWDYAPHIEKPHLGHHVTRKREHELLLDFLCRRTEGALLVSGKRGVGKTSAVYSAINEAICQLKNNNVKVLPVLVNAPSFDIRKIILEKDAKSDQTDLLEFMPGQNYKGNAIDSKSDQTDLLEFKHVVLQNIARRLYKLAEQKEGEIEKEIYDRISDLFKRAVAKEVKQEIKDEETQQRRSLIEKEAVMNLGTTKKLLGIVVSFISAGIISLHPVPSFGIGNTILPILIGIVPAVAITVSLAFKKTDKSETGSNQSAFNYYRKDYDVSNLQAELEETFDTLIGKKYKVIIIIDELDKMKEEDIINVITSLKILFNQSSAIFVLVIGQEYFMNMIKRGKERLKEYTLFSNLSSKTTIL